MNIERKFITVALSLAIAITALARGTQASQGIMSLQPSAQAKEALAATRLSKRAASRILAMRCGTPEGWRKWLVRLETQEFVRDDKLDEFLTVMGR